jgi:hypothetical protein
MPYIMYTLFDGTKRFKEPERGWIKRIVRIGPGFNA